MFLGLKPYRKPISLAFDNEYCNSRVCNSIKSIPVGVQMSDVWLHSFACAFFFTILVHFKDWDIKQNHHG